jgi:hypothetical protein
MPSNGLPKTIFKNSHIVYLFSYLLALKKSTGFLKTEKFKIFQGSE